MNRRDFLKLSLCAGCSSLIPAFPRLAAAGPLDAVNFDIGTYSKNTPQTIMVFLYGGPSELAGNFTNYNITTFYSISVLFYLIIFLNFSPKSHPI